ncbi:MAG: endolytic transglycosylase MltG [Acidimicrobiia bacterium]
MTEWGWPQEPDDPHPHRLWRMVGVGVFLAVSAGLVVMGGQWLGRFVSSGGPTSTVTPGLQVEVDIPPGANAESIGEILADAGVVASASDFEVAVRTSGSAERLQAGRYPLFTGMAITEVLAQLEEGPPAATFRVTVPEGLRVTEILVALAEASGHPRSELEAALTDGSVATTLRELPENPELAEWEGLLFPDTYEFADDAQPEEMLQLLADTMEDRVEGVDWSSLEEDGLTPYQGIVIASLIESEVQVVEEQPLVSSVIHNRLAQEMRLEIDATVLYALDTRDVAEFNRDVDSPYNTYRVEGLPPTPISAPGLAALEAAAAPADTPFLFYVLSDEDGHHTFSETFEEHQQAVQQAKEDGVIP